MILRLGRIAWSGAAAIALLCALASCGGGGSEATSGARVAPHQSSVESFSMGEMVRLPHPGKRVPEQGLCDGAVVQRDGRPDSLTVSARCYSGSEDGHGNLMVSRYVVGHPLRTSPILSYSARPTVAEHGLRVRLGSCHRLEVVVSCAAPIHGPSRMSVHIRVKPETQCRHGISVISILYRKCRMGELCARPITLYRIFHGRPQGC